MRLACRAPAMKEVVEDLDVVGDGGTGLGEHPRRTAPGRPRSRRCGPSRRPGWPCCGPDFITHDLLAGEHRALHRAREGQAVEVGKPSNVDADAVTFLARGEPGQQVAVGEVGLVCPSRSCVARVEPGLCELGRRRRRLVSMTARRSRLLRFGAGVRSSGMNQSRSAPVRDHAEGQLAPRKIGRRRRTRARR